MESLSDAELYRRILDQRIRDLWVAMPGLVKAVDMTNQTVDVQPVLQRVIPRGDDETDSPEAETLPVVPAVPLVFPRGGGFFVSVPVAVGDSVMLVFSDRDIGRWRETGQVPCNPGDQRAHTLSGAVAFPGVFPRGAKLADASPTNMVLGKDGTPGMKITITPTQVQVDGSGDAAALASKVNALFNAFCNAVPVAMDGGAAIQNAVKTVWTGFSNTVASTKLKLGG